uniref:RNA exonuclease 4 n=1 Tax=Cyprinodon variegatus TaxID=28743 RepID=A0A3Q2D2C4_CYPVA
MTKAKAKTAHPDAKTTAKDKRKKFWIKHNLKQKSDKTTTPKKHQEKPVPPQEPQQISANWKSLQQVGRWCRLMHKGFQDFFCCNIFLTSPQILKSSQTEKTHHNGVITTKNPEKDFKNTSTNSATLSQKDCGRKGKEDLWFDDVDPDDIEETMGAEAAEIMRKKQGIHSRSKETDNALVKDKSFDGITKVVAIDCEMVGVGPAGEESILARVSLVNKFGKCIYDKYVKPTEKVTDYRTAVSGIRPEDIEDGEDIQTVQREVADILQGRIVVGHAIHNDLKILLLDHPKKKIRDTQKYKPFRRIAKSCRPSLKVLCKEVLNVKVQQGEHSSVQDAQATMRLYTLVRKQWEAEIKAGKKSKDSGEKKKRKPR